MLGNEVEMEMEMAKTKKHYKKNALRYFFLLFLISYFQNNINIYIITTYGGNEGGNEVEMRWK